MKAAAIQEVVDITAQKIKQIRSSSDLSQDDFAALAKLTRSYYGAVETGRFNLSLSKICIIARYLGVEPGDLLPTLKELEAIIVDDESETVKSVIHKKQKARRDRKKAKAKVS